MTYTHEEIMADKKLRVAYWEMNFWFWFTYHFWWKMKRFQKDWCKSLQSDQNTFLVWFRASRKTTLVRWYVCWCIAYKKHPSIIVQSYEDSLSSEWVREVAKMLFKKSVVEDHGNLFPVEKQSELEKKSASNFESTNWVKVSAKSMWQTIRWSNTFDIEEEMSARPTLLILDDIDVVKSVENIKIIDKNEKKIMGETIPALDPLRRKIVFLWNIINEDWIVPRLKRRFEDTTTRDIFFQPLFDEQWVNARPEVFDDKVVETIKADWKTSYNQNYLLIPSQKWSGVFIRKYFDYFLNSHFEDPASPLKKSDLRCAIFCDPAFSSSDTSDDAVVVGGAEHKINKNYYIIDWYADTSAPSKTIDALITMYNKMTMEWYKPEFISVESVTINKRQTEFIKELKAKLIEHQINCPVHLYEPRTNKLARIKDNLESIMSQQWIKSNKNMSDQSFISKFEWQALEYPNGDFDDCIDCVSQMIEVFRIKKDSSAVREKKKRRIWSVEKWAYIEIRI